VEIGDFFLLSDRSIDEHPYVIISMPDLDPDQVVIVSFTSYNEPYHEIVKDGSCILRSDDHPWIHHKTCVSYRDGKIVKKSELERLESAGHITFREPVSNGILQRILQGAEQTDELPGKCRKVLEDQDLIES